MDRIVYKTRTGEQGKCYAYITNEIDESGKRTLLMSASKNAYMWERWRLFADEWSYRVNSRAESRDA